LTGEISICFNHCLPGGYRFIVSRRIAAPLRGVLSIQKNTLVLLGEAEDVDPQVKRVRFARDGPLASNYDSLIVATGTETSYYGNDSWRKWAPSLKTVEEATAIATRFCMHSNVPSGRTPGRSERVLTFIIVGAAPRGSNSPERLRKSLANAAPRFSKDRVRRRRGSFDGGAPRVLGPFPEDLSAKAEKLVTGLGVEVIKGVMVTDIDAGGVTSTRRFERDASAKTRAVGRGRHGRSFGRTCRHKVGVGP